MRIRFLGTGAAEGIPAMGCECDHCARARQEGGRLARQRNALLISLPGYELLVDVPPDTRELLDTNGIRSISGIFLTHEHFDHAAGLAEFLYWRQEVDLFAEPGVYQRLIQENWDDQIPEITFHCAFRPGVTIHFNDFSLTPFEVRHNVPCFGLALYEGERRVIHVSDSDTRISNYARGLMNGADVLIVNTPFFEPREGQAHLSIEEAVTLKDEAGVKQLILTHLNHYNRPHDELENYVRQFPGVIVAYDGMTTDV